MISSGIRLFKGYNGYDETKRMLFDIETTGLNPEKDSIDQIGIRTNKGYEKIIEIVGDTEEEKKECEHASIEEFVKIFAEEKPDVVAGHNSENFDWDFFIVKWNQYGGETFEDMTKKYLLNGIYKKKKDSVLKLGGEVEYFKPTTIWGTTVLDSLHAVRRAQAIDSDIKSANLKYVTNYLGLKKENRVYVPGDKIGKTWREIDDCYALNEENGDWYKVSETKPISDGYKSVSGRYIVERYLLDDIYETDKVELTLNEANFLISKMLPTTFQRACTMGTAGIWKLIMIAWCYENNLAIPSFGQSRTFTGGLSRLLKVGYVDRIVKLDYNSLYPSIMLTWWVSNNLDITDSMLNMLDYVLSNREKYKNLKNAASTKAKKIKSYINDNKDKLTEDEINKFKEELKEANAEKNANDKKQSPLKVLGNSVFGSFGAPSIFPFGNSNAAERVTCIGRQCLRLMISHFNKLGYEPIVGDTDGFNFQMPTDDKFRYTKEHPYISNGGGRNSVKGKAYVGVDADVCEFEDMYFNHAWNGGINKMGLGIDEFCDSTINFSRKNYADLLENGKTKKVGNTIKSRRMAGYIDNFLNPAIDMLLHGKGWEFLNMYYDYIEKIYNYQIPVKDICSKGKIKKTLEEYKADCQTLTKAGTKKSRQVWYELAIRNNQKVDINDTIYYINNADGKSQSSDVKKILRQYTIVDGVEYELKGKVKTTILKEWCTKNNFDYKELKTAKVKEILQPHIKWEEEEININCIQVPLEIAESEENLLCSDLGDEFEYNVEKYIEAFNKRIKVLLVCFHPNIRESILITNPSQKPQFTEKECQLCSGYPNKETDQDTLDNLMTPERKEIEFWFKSNETPPFVNECGIHWEELVDEYKKIKEKENDIIFQEENEKYLKALENLYDADIDNFWEDGTIPSSISAIVELHSDMHLYFKKLNDMTPSTGGYIFEDLTHKNNDLESEEEYENASSGQEYSD